jgi:CRP-like cAMP-binding protein
MRSKKPQRFDLKAFLASGGDGRTIVEFRTKQTLFSQEDPADAVFYVIKGKIRLTVLSRQGKEAVIATLGPDDFFGEGCLAGQRLRMATASATTDGSLVRLEKKAIIRLLHDQPTFSELFMSYVLSRNIRIEEDLVDQLFNSSEKRLARTLLLLAHVGKGKKGGECGSQDQSRDFGRNDRHDAGPSEFLYEQVQAVRLHRVQRCVASSQFTAEYCPSRLEPRIAGQ